MEIMESSKQNDRLVFDDIRQQFVPATPEELVRQHLIKKLIHHLGFPRHLIAVEKKLSELPHLQETNLPSRRIDILCFAKDIHPRYPLYPLLLIECKEGVLKEDAYEQVLGYNHFIQSFYVAVAGKDEVKLIFPKRLSFLPSYKDLLSEL
jgi:hypothetical protein